MGGGYHDNGGHGGHCIENSELVSSTISVRTTMRRVSEEAATKKMVNRLG